MNKNIKKIGKAVAGSALLVGATLTGAAGLASAADGSQDLGDYPEPFVSEDGEVQSTVVVGESAQTVDVVGAVNIAGSLGNAAFTEEEVSAGSTGASWSASSGAVLSTVNQNLYMGDDADAARSTLTSDELSLLESGGDVADDYEYDQYLNVMSNYAVDYAAADDMDDPAVVLDGSGNIYQAEVVFNDNLDNETAGDTIELFGQTFTLSSDEADISSDEIVMYGSSLEETISSGESSTISVDGEEHTIEVQAVNEDGVVYSVDGDSPEQDEQGDTFDIGDTTVRIDSMINLADDSGSATFSVGSDRVLLEDGQEVQVGEDEEDVDGTTVGITGDGDSVSSITVDVQADDSDNSHVVAGESFEDPVFGTFNLAFGGLSPDAQDEAEEISVQTDGDNDATVDFTTSGGESATINFAHAEDASSDAPALEDSDQNPIHVAENASVGDEEYTVLESGDFSRLVQVTDFETNYNDNSEDEVVVTFEDAVTGTEWEATIGDGATDNTDDFADGSTTKVIDGQTYTLTASDASTVHFADNTDSTHDVYEGLETDNGAEVSLTKQDAALNGVAVGDTIQLPTGTIDVAGNTGVTQNNGTVEVDPLAANIGSAEVETVGGIDYVFEETGGSAGSATVQVSVADAWDGDDSFTEIDSPAVLVVEEEGEDSQNAHLVSAATDTASDEERVELGDAADLSSAAGTATFVSTDSRYDSLASHDDNDIQSDYSVYGTFVEEDSSNAGAYSFMYPAAQSTAGVGVTTEGGELSTSGGAGTVTSMSPTGWPDSAALDSDANVDSLKTSEELILVGGPSVNALTQELADENKTMQASEYSEGSATVQLVNNAFAEGQDALVVAGYAGEDTREAANYISNYEDNAEDLAGETSVELTTQQSQNAE